jgi:hypothetical protein
VFRTVLQRSMARSWETVRLSRSSLFTFIQALGAPDTVTAEDLRHARRARA